MKHFLWSEFKAAADQSSRVFLDGYSLESLHEPELRVCFSTTPVTAPSAAWISKLGDPGVAGDGRLCIIQRLPGDRRGGQAQIHSLWF